MNCTVIIETQTTSQINIDKYEMRGEIYSESIWVEPARKGKGQKKLGILPLTYRVLLTTYIFFALLEIVMSLKHIEASHIMAFNS